MSCWAVLVQYPELLNFKEPTQTYILRAPEPQNLGIRRKLSVSQSISQLTAAPARQESELGAPSPRNTVRAPCPGTAPSPQPQPTPRTAVSPTSGTTTRSYSAPSSTHRSPGQGPLLSAPCSSFFQVCRSPALATAPHRCHRGGQVTSSLCHLGTLGLQYQVGRGCHSGQEDRSCGYFGSLFLQGFFFAKSSYFEYPLLLPLPLSFPLIFPVTPLPFLQCSLVWSR